MYGQMIRCYFSVNLKFQSKINYVIHSINVCFKFVIKDNLNHLPGTIYKVLSRRGLFI